MENPADMEIDDFSENLTEANDILLENVVWIQPFSTPHKWTQKIPQTLFYSPNRIASLT